MTKKALSTKKISTKEEALKLLNHYDHFLFDCDGVIWLGPDIIPGAAELIEHLTKMNKSYAFVTNNSSVSRENYMKKFEKLGIPNVAKNLIFPSCYAAALILKRDLKIPEGSKVWVLGDEGIETELKEAGYVPVGGNDPALDDAWSPDHPLLQVDEDVKAVVVGSTKKFNYMRVSTTLQYLLHKNRSLPFVGTNIDRTYPGPNGTTLPAGGSVVFYMKFTADRDFIDVGKPSSRLLDSILKNCSFDRNKTLMVGDTLYTDVKFGNDGKLGGEAGSSLLVLSGGTSQEEVDQLDGEDPSTVPSYYIESVGHLVDLLRG
ncbi:4-nitrophenylphosphatase [Candidozyma auris]|uniref:4-nitrophenylphosphatase n=2 Tax=Candidozyma auris TaxID=498019 RepID=A0A2H0ZIX4_CANAR|nr:hypothetical protein QG37_04479 [[Candida] auris]PIS50589.1 hypothetical protein B9J08_004417 [[Candida] auris]QWW25617.1 hypothetical protein CA7LBN_004504 [[Candida] auris]